MSVQWQNRPDYLSVLSQSLMIPACEHDTLTALDKLCAKNNKRLRLWLAEIGDHMAHVDLFPNDPWMAKTSEFEIKSCATQDGPDSTLKWLCVYNICVCVSMICFLFFLFFLQFNSFWFWSSIFKSNLKTFLFNSNNILTAVVLTLANTVTLSLDYIMEFPLCDEESVTEWNRTEL